MISVIKILVYSVDIYLFWYFYIYLGFYVIGIIVYYIKIIFFVLLLNLLYFITIYYLKGMFGNYGKWFIKDK